MNIRSVANAPQVNSTVEEKLRHLREKDKEMLNSDSAPNGNQNEPVWGDEEARPRTPDDDWHEDSPPQVKSEAIHLEAKLTGPFIVIKTFVPCNAEVQVKRNIHMS